MHRSGTASNEFNNAVCEDHCVNCMPILPDKHDLSRFICQADESAIGAMERCLDNGLGVCFIVDQAGRLIVDGPAN